MANFLTPGKLGRLRELLEAGVSHRKAAPIVGCSKVTVLRYRKLWGISAICACGDDSRHQGWCWWRYKQSPARQEFMAASVPVLRSSLRWPFTATEDELVSLVNGLVPKGLSFQVRDEVCQDICLAVLDGSVRRDELEGTVERFIKAVFRQYPPKYGPRSLDAPLRHEDSRTLYDVLPGRDLNEQVPEALEGEAD